MWRQPFINQTISRCELRLNPTTTSFWCRFTSNVINSKLVWCDLMLDLIRRSCCLLARDFLWKLSVVWEIWRCLVSMLRCHSWIKRFYLSSSCHWSLLINLLLLIGILYCWQFHFAWDCRRVHGTLWDLRRNFSCIGTFTTTTLVWSLNPWKWWTCDKRILSCTSNSFPVLIVFCFTHLTVIRIV
jgi:hypothetical protein